MLRELKIRLKFTSGNAKSELEHLQDELDRAKEDFKELGSESSRSMKGMDSAFKDLGKNLVDSRSKFDLMAKSTGLSTKQIEELVNTTRKDMKLDEQFREAAKMAGLTKSEIDKVKGSIDSAKQSTANWKSMFSGMASLGLTALAGQFAASGVKQAAEFEDINIQFEVLMGNADKAKNTIADLQKFTAKTPFESDQVLKAGRQLLAVNVPAEKLIDNLKMIGDVSKGSGKDFNELATIFAKNKSSNFIQGEDLNQLIEAGIPILDEFSKMFGKSAIEVKKMGSKNQIEFKHLQQAFRNLTGEGGKYNDMMGRLSKTSLGMWSTVSDGIKQMSKGFGIMILDILKPVLRFFTDAEKGSARLRFAFTILGVVIGTGLVMATNAWIASLNATTIAAMKTWVAVLGPALIIAAKLLVIYLILEDIWTFFEYGPAASDSYFESLLRGMGLTDEQLQDLSDGFKYMKQVFKDAWLQITEWFKDPTIRNVLIGIGIAIALIVAPALILGAALFALKMLLVVGVIAGIAWVIANWEKMTDYISEKWNEFTEWFSEAWKSTLDFFKKYGKLAGKLIIAFLFPIAGIYLFRKEIYKFFVYLKNLIRDSVDWSGLWDSAVAIFNRIKNYISGIWDSIWNRLSRTFDLSNIKTFLVDALNDAIRSINKAMKDIPGIGRIWTPIALVEAREKGGPVNAGSPYLVGEKGPELIIPGSSGNVIPNNKLESVQPASRSNSISIQFGDVHFNVSGTSSTEIAQDGFEKLMSLIEENEQRLRMSLGLELGEV